MRHDTWDACEENFRADGWDMNPKIIAVLVRDGTPDALQFYSRFLVEKFLLNYLYAETLLEALSLGMYVDVLTLRWVGWLALRPEDGHTRGWMSNGMVEIEYAFHHMYHDDLFQTADAPPRQGTEDPMEEEEGEEEEDEDEEEEEGASGFSSRGEALRLLRPLAESLSWQGTTGSDLVNFVRTFPSVYAYPDEPHLLQARPLFMDVLRILIERGFPFDAPNEEPYGYEQNTSTHSAREMLLRWGKRGPASALLRAMWIEVVCCVPYCLNIFA